MNNLLNKFKTWVIIWTWFIFTVLLIWWTYAFVLSNVNGWTTLTSQMWNTMINNQVPVWTILSWHKSMTWVPSLKDGWLECDGSVINDSESPMNWQTLPNLNWEARFLRWWAVSWIEQDSSVITDRQWYWDPAYPILQNNDWTINNFWTSTYMNPLSNVSSYTIRGHKIRPVNMSVVYIIKIK